VHPGGNTAPDADITNGATTIQLPAAKAPYFAAAKYIEIWNGDMTVLEEIVEITSVGATSATVSAVEGGTYASGSTQLRAVLDTFTKPRGTKLLEGGSRLIGAGNFVMENTNQMSDKLPAGLCLSMRFKTSGVAGQRNLAINFSMRKPS